MYYLSATSQTEIMSLDTLSDPIFLSLRCAAQAGIPFLD
jgi:hypothetical protein